MRLLLVALVTAGIFTGCTTTNPATTAPPSPIPAVTPSPTLDIEATIEARLMATIEARPTPTPLPTAIPSSAPTLAPKPTETPRPTPTAIPTATPTPTPTPLPPTPTPTVTPALLELHDTQNTRWLKRAYRDLYRQIQWFPWVQDGLSEVETNTIDELLYIGAGEIANLRATLNLPWVQDSISETEYDIIYWISSLNYRDSQVASAVIAMPFLDFPDRADTLALRGMHRLAQEHVLAALTEHPTFQDSITEVETELVAAAATLFRDAEEIGHLLDPGYAAIETVSGGTELTPGLKVSIVRTGTQSRPGTVEAVKDAVAFVERVMGLPLPVDHVISC